MPNIFTSHDVTTGKDGRFVFERVFPGKARIGRRILVMVDDGATEVTSSSRISADFFSGKTTHLDLGGTGRPVVGKLAPPDGYSEKVLWSFALINVEADLAQPPAPTPPMDPQNDPEKYQQWRKEWKQSAGGQAWSAAYQSYRRRKADSPYITASVAQDGAFRLDDVPAGD